MPGNASYELTYTGQSAGTPALYVFNKGTKGFIITSADDRMPALLGYSDNGSFDLNNASPELKWWLSQYVDEAAYFFKNEGKFTLSSRASTEREDILPLIKTKWNQGQPYNLDCPEDKGGRSVTGCVATAMAQIIKYHRFPVTGTGEHSYSWNGTTLSFDYGAAVFDYGNMLDEYDPYEDTATETQKRAVAQLMYACGVGVNMKYSSGESGAGDYGIPYALKNLFNYDNGVRYVKRSYYTTQEWEDMVYSELQGGYPVLYSGRSPAGHAFVCDGYENGYFHINWGWGGTSDGYYLLSALNPHQQGIGGSAGGYNADQSIICGIKPGRSSYEPTYSICATGPIEVNEVMGNIFAVVTVNGGMICNYSPDTYSVGMAFKAVSDTGEEYIGNETNMEFKGALENYEGYSGFGLYIPSNLSAGHYKVYLIYKTPEGDWRNVMTPISANEYLNMDVNASGEVSFSMGEPKSIVR